MEFDININLILRDVITKVDNRLQVCRTAQARFPDARHQLFQIIDKMGEASARAQALPGAITTGRKLEVSDHYLYVMKDPEGTRGNGAVVGILKMGRKRLFVYDRHGQQWEMNPLCVLDFYVHESRQRMGCGRRLFDFMLKVENTVPQHLAVDRPSLKFASFLAKHYGLTSDREIQQVNNFVIFQGFFTKREETDFVHNKRNQNMPRPADGTDVADNHHQHQRANNNYNKMYNYNHGNTAAGLPTLVPRHRNAQSDKVLKELNINPRSAHIMHSGSPDGLSDIELRSMSAGSGSNKGTQLPLQMAMYSRHQPIRGDSGKVGANLPPNGNRNAATRNPNRPPSGNRNHEANGKMVGGGDGSNESPDGNTQNEATNWNSDGFVENTSANANAEEPNPPVSQPSDICEGSSEPNDSKGKGIELEAPLCWPYLTTTIASCVSQSPRTAEPPLLQRGGPPKDYAENFNLHQNYQGRAGHLLVPHDPRLGISEATKAAKASSPTKETSIRPPPDSVRSVYSHGGGGGGGSVPGGFYTHPSLHTNGDTSWTVFGVLRKQQHLSQSARHQGHSRLW